MRIPEQGAERWCPHAYWRASSSSTGSYGGVSAQRPEEETGQIQCGWRFGQWSYTAHGPDHLPGMGALPKSGIMLQAPLLLCLWTTIAALQWETPVPSHPHERSSPKGPHQTLHCLILIPVPDQRDARPSEPPSPMDQGRDGQGKRSPLLVEGDQGHQKVHPKECPQKVHHRGRPQWTQDLALFLSGRLWPSGCPFPNRRHWVGGILQPVFMDCILGISCPLLMPLE